MIDRTAVVHVTAHRRCARCGFYDEVTGPAMPFRSPEPALRKAERVLLKSTAKRPCPACGLVGGQPV